MQFLSFECANIEGEAVASFMASSLGYFLKVEPGQAFLHKCVSCVVAPGMFFGTGEARAATRNARKLLGANCEPLKLSFFCYGSSGRLHAPTLQKRTAEGPMTSWSTMWVPPVDSSGSPSPCRGVHSFYGWYNKSRERKKLLHYFQGLVIWLTWSSAWLACKKPWVSSLVPHILSMAVYTCNLSTQEAAGRGYMANSLAYMRSCLTNYPAPQLCILEYLFPHWLWLI